MSLDVSVTKNFNGFSLDVRFQSTGEILGILGASGCGKSMTLRCIAGIETPSSGRVTMGDRVLYDSERKINLKPQKRRVGYLFQSYALFPNMRVEDNIGCSLGHLNKQERAEKVRVMVERFHLEGLERRYPAQLSGGQQQRVALARIMAQEPEVLLLDEPFSALDYFLREQLQAEMPDYLNDCPGDIVMVTHSRDEAYRLCQKLMILDGGRCVMYGDTGTVFEQPRYLAAARLTGCKNFSRACRIDSHTVEALDWGVRLKVAGPVADDIDCIGVRAHHFRPADATPGCVNRFAVQVNERLESQFEWNVVFTTPDAAQPQKIWWMIGKDRYDGGTTAYLAVEPQHILLLNSKLPQ